MTAQHYWMAARKFRAATTLQERHDARVALLQIALVDDPAGRRAAAILQKEGLLVVRNNFVSVHY